MYALNTNITFTFVLDAEYQATYPTTMDVMFVDPNGLTIYDENGTSYGAVYTPGVPPVDETSDGTPGSYVFTRSFAVEGHWKVGITSGTCSSFALWESVKVHVQASDPEYNLSYQFRA